jgi:hypothetical protein
MFLASPTEQFVPHPACCTVQQSPNCWASCVSCAWLHWCPEGGCSGGEHANLCLYVLAFWLASVCTCFFAVLVSACGVFASHHCCCTTYSSPRPQQHAQLSRTVCCGAGGDATKEVLEPEMQHVTLSCHVIAGMSQFVCLYCWGAWAILLSCRVTNGDNWAWRRHDVVCRFMLVLMLL